VTVEFLPLIALAVLFWFLLVRGPRRRMAAHRALQDALAVDDEVVTASGLYGRITALDDDVAHLEIAPGTVVKIDRRAVSGKVESAESSLT
jgi:preprotein translocase subunit YajC